METPRLVVGAASRAPPPTPRFRRRRLPRQRGGAHCFPFARAAPPVLLTRCSYSSSSSSREGNGNSRGKPRRESSNTVRLDVEADSDQVPSMADEQREGDVGELFSLAQRNILYINKQRLMAMEELKKLQDENNLLLEEIQVLETEMQGIPLEAAQSSSFSELLLRIDTMAISGMISMAEASHLREKVVTNRSIIQSAFSDIHHKPNTELLSELRIFLYKPIEYDTTYLTFLQFAAFYSNFLQCYWIPMSIFFLLQRQLDTSNCPLAPDMAWLIPDTLRKNRAAEGERKLMCAIHEREKNGRRQG